MLGTGNLDDGTNGLSVAQKRIGWRQPGRGHHVEVCLQVCARRRAADASPPYPAHLRQVSAASLPLKVK